MVWMPQSCSCLKISEGDEVRTFYSSAYWGPRPRHRRETKTQQHRPALLGRGGSLRNSGANRKGRWRPPRCLDSKEEAVRSGWTPLGLDLPVREGAAVSRSQCRRHEQREPAKTHLWFLQCIRRRSTPHTGTCFLGFLVKSWETATRGFCKESARASLRRESCFHSCRWRDVSLKSRFLDVLDQWLWRCPFGAGKKFKTGTSEDLSL